MRIILAALALAACSPQPASAPPAEPTAQIEAPLSTATITTPAPNARVTSPLTVSGRAPAGWFFENQLPVQLLDAQGAVITQAPATPRINWTEPGDKDYDATLTFSVTRETPATLVIMQDMPGEGQEPEQTRMDVVLAPN
jgi:Immunoglobulin-like domain of bacterial spore germination